jgi:hypothetical protein
VTHPELGPTCISFTLMRGCILARVDPFTLAAAVDLCLASQSFVAEDSSSRGPALAMLQSIASPWVAHNYSTVVWVHVDAGCVA